MSMSIAADCFDVSDDVGDEIDEFRGLFPNKEDLRVVLEDYFNIYNDWAEMSPSEFDAKFKKYMDKDFKDDDEEN